MPAGYAVLVGPGARPPGGIQGAARGLAARRRPSATFGGPVANGTLRCGLVLGDDAATLRRRAGAGEPAHRVGPGPTTSATFGLTVRPIVAGENPCAEVFGVVRPARRAGRPCGRSAPGGPRGASPRGAGRPMPSTSYRAASCEAGPLEHAARPRVRRRRGHPLAAASRPGSPPRAAPRAPPHRPRRPSAAHRRCRGPATAARPRSSSRPRRPRRGAAAASATGPGAGTPRAGPRPTQPTATPSSQRHEPGRRVAPTSASRSARLSAAVVFVQLEPGLRQNWHQHHFGSPPTANSSASAGHRSRDAGTTCMDVMGMPPRAQASRPGSRSRTFAAMRSRSRPSSRRRRCSRACGPPRQRSRR